MAFAAAAAASAAVVAMAQCWFDGQNGSGQGGMKWTNGIGHRDLAG